MALQSVFRPRLPSASSPCGIDHDFATLPPAAYGYLLGLYLGDGCISRSGRVWKLRITLDASYPGIIRRCREAIDILMPGSAQRRYIAPIVASKSCCTRNTGRAYSRSMVRGGST
jgi:hypothetical protein